MVDYFMINLNNTDFLIMFKSEPMLFKTIWVYLI